MDWVNFGVGFEFTRPELLFMLRFIVGLYFGPRLVTVWFGYRLPFNLSWVLSMLYSMLTIGLGYGSTIGLSLCLGSFLDRIIVGFESLLTWALFCIRFHLYVGLLFGFGLDCCLGHC